MKSFKILLFFLIISLSSCDDGDIIVTSFEFDDATLQLCEGSKENEFVFFKINTSNNEAISFNFIDDTFSETKETASPIIIQLDDNNKLIYRQFNVAIDNNYFCNSIPPSNIIVTEEFVSVQGNAEIIVQIIEEDDNDGVDPIVESGGIDPTADPDGDGVPNYLDDDRNNASTGNVNGLIEAGFDTDNDGIPNFKDQDDDNDNILTSIEFPDDDPDTDNPRDTDGDNIPDYLDNDDDGDKVLTINEDIDENGNPRDDDYDGDGIFNYLDNDDDDDGVLTINEDSNGDNDPRNDDNDMDMIPDYLDTDPNPNDENIPFVDLNPSLSNTVITTFRSTVSFTDLMFNANNSNLQNNIFSFGNKEVTISITDEEN
ncbi:hypothetical protein [Aquimarina sp. MMG016]|uniref:hypothetical protein n=1 Tax=Aquimarina sp. MMG016 TaxID=2822690 RepID=UPI001B3A55F6|nr:hypothetical protein [Aquimarina sp. MMG016]MBQ4821249.1 hypothetical protein [Aquimarina sp. MMG016]